MKEGKEEGEGEGREECGGCRGVEVHAGMSGHLPHAGGREGQQRRAPIKHHHAHVPGWPCQSPLRAASLWFPNKRPPSSLSATELPSSQT